MRNGLLAAALRKTPPVKHKVFVSYHHKSDQDYYDKFSSTFHDTHESIHDNSLERAIDSDDAEYVMRRIRENHISGSSCSIILIGAETWGRKYVDWEIKATLDKEHGLIGVYLPTAARNEKNNIIVPGRLYDNIASGYALWLSWTDLTLDPTQLEQKIADSKSRSVALINNDRELRKRDA
jgi:hypothetical protein